MITLKEIAKVVDGTIAGDEGLQVKGMAPYDFAKEGDITFAFDEAGLKQVKESEASCVLTTEEIENYPKTVLRVGDMKMAMTILYNTMLEVNPPEKGIIHLSAIIAENVSLGENVSIGPNVVIAENSQIGDNASIDANCVIGKNIKIGKKTHIYSNVTLYDNVVIGNNVGIHSGTVIGSDGFGYIPKGEKIYKVPQMGKVIIEDDAEIGANTCVDRGTFTDTVIGRGTKIDNLVQIAHNVKLGKNILIAAQVGIAGSTVVGENTMIGGQVGIADHATIGKNVKLAAKSGVSGRVKDNSILFGYPSRDSQETKKLYRLLSMLTKNKEKIKALLKTLPDVQKREEK